MQRRLLKKLLLRTEHQSRFWVALFALGTGIFLFLIAVLIWCDFNEILNGKNANESVAKTYIIIGKKVTDNSMGKRDANRFAVTEIDSLRKLIQVEDVGLISSNQFPVYAMMGGRLGFATEMPLESVPDKFLDKLPNEWQWQPGTNDLPIILSSQFLNIYNYGFAPSQGLPQLSENTVKALSLKMKIGLDGHDEIVIAHVVGFSDRIGSVLVPQSFIDYGNKTYGNGIGEQSVSQLILKVKDPSDKRFIDFLQKHDYVTNPENLKWSQMRVVVQTITGVTGILAVLLMGIGTLVIILFIELTIAKARHSLVLLMQIGYSPTLLSRFMIQNFLPFVLITSVVSLLFSIIAQIIIVQYLKTQLLSLPILPDYVFWVNYFGSTLLLMAIVIKSIRKVIR